MSWTNLVNQNMQERYEHIKEKERRNSEDYGESGSHTEIRLNKSLSVTLDGFDHLLCRQCMVNTTKLTIFCMFVITMLSNMIMNISRVFIFVISL
jgi:hypothetical protein